MSSMIVLLVLIAKISASASLLDIGAVRSYTSRSIMPLPVDTDPAIVDSIAGGTQLAIEYCQHHFKWDRWNCPRTTFTRKHHLLPNKETAYAKAIVAAGIVYEITKNCSKGVIAGCGCDQAIGRPSTAPAEDDDVIGNRTEVLSSLIQAPPNNKSTPRWFWGGCSDEPSFAIDVAMKFLTAVDKDMMPPAYVARHNSKVGSEVVRRTMVKKCRCHGISGSCSLRTCWMQMASFGEISKKLKEYYRRSERLTYEAVAKSMSVENTAKHEMIETEIEGVEHSLVHLEQSPDYCVANSAEGISGTKGRLCSRNATASMAEKNSCRNLCRKCGHSVKRVKKSVPKRCDCKFEWCCEVKCDTCYEKFDEFYCA